MKRKICVVTGSRAEYGLLRWVMEGIRQSPELMLQIIATGMHLSPEFGLTYREIEQDGFQIDRKIEMLLSADTPSAIAKSMGLGMISFSDAFEELKPDILLVLGDRFEVFSAVSAAMVACIPVAHLHGGESTEGLIDEAIRHAITKMAHLHFVAADPYRQRVIQLGEEPTRVFLVGGLGVDNIRRLALLDKASLEEQLNFKFLKRNLLITFHPVTLENDTAYMQLTELLMALATLKNIGLIFTMPNADARGRKLFSLIEEFVSACENACAYTSLGSFRYLSCLQYVDGIVGNSSSGLMEMPTFRKGTINIGERQRGRLKAESIIDCLPDRSSIASAIDILYSINFQNILLKTHNPYGDGGASDRIVDILKSIALDSIIKKTFCNLM